MARIQVGLLLLLPPSFPVDVPLSRKEYIQPIREIFGNSTRPEIVSMRASFVGLETIPAPTRSDPGFRCVPPAILIETPLTLKLSSALVEESAFAFRRGTA